MSTKRYLITVLVVMAFFTVFVRAVVLRPVLSAAGPELVSHDLSERYENRCDLCHRKVIPYHEKNFGNFDNCMNCHGGAPKTPHATDGGMSICVKCHDGIFDSHDLMFPKISYETCVGCHPQSK